MNCEIKRAVDIVIGDQAFIGSYYQKVTRIGYESGNIILKSVDGERVCYPAENVSVRLPKPVEPEISSLDRRLKDLDGLSLTELVTRHSDVKEELAAVKAALQKRINSL